MRIAVPMKIAPKMPPVHDGQDVRPAMAADSRGSPDATMIVSIASTPTK